MNNDNKNDLEDNYKLWYKNRPGTSGYVKGEFNKDKTLNTEARFMIRISALKENNMPTKYSFDFEPKGFIWNERKNWYSSFYELKNVTADEVRMWRTYANGRGLKLTYFDEEYTRSTNYRSTYFKENRPIIAAKYRCVYCGKKFTQQKITVDHIYPVNKMMYRQTTRDRAALSGINGTNDVKNLVAACKSCNSKKGTKMGIWILKAKLGRHEWYWKIKRIVQVTIILSLLYLVYKNSNYSFHSFVKI